MKSWFSTQVERSLQGALEVAQLYYRDLSLRSVHWSKRVYRGEDLQKARTEGGLSWLGVYDRKGRLLKKATSESTPAILAPPEELIRQALEGKEVTKVTPFEAVSYTHLTLPTN